MLSARYRAELYDPENFHDACGTGFIAETIGKPSRRVITHALSALKRLSHRGAKSADEKTGDGAGILLDIPMTFFGGLLQNRFGYYLEKNESLAIAMIFTSAVEQGFIEKQARKLIGESQFQWIGVREVPVNPDALGELARSSCPKIIQIFAACKSDSPEPQLFYIRRKLEKAITGNEYKSFICSFSSKTIVYKGLMTASQLDLFYPDLMEPDLKARVVLFHERFSTNTKSTWAMAQPFRMLAHNGEINTIKGNRLWMQAREREMTSPFWGDKLKDLKPLVENSGSDSFSLDNALEFLNRSGRDMFHAMMMLVPEPYAENPEMPEAQKDFYIFHENYIEPWDGPAALVFTDGDFVGAKLDRNGLRPLRYSISADGLVIMASEAGVVPLTEDNLVLHHHMASGEIFALALDGSGIMDDAQVKEKIASQADYPGQLKKRFRVIERGDAQQEFSDFAIPEHGFDQRLRLALGWNEEDLTRFLIPMAESGREPIGSMGDDSPPPMFSVHDRRLYDYFKQAFAQVTNPPIDPIREKFVMALFKYLGSEENLLSDEPRFHGAIRIASPVLSPREVSILYESHGEFPHRKIMCHLAPQADFETELGRIRKECEQAVLEGAKILFFSDENIREDTLPIPMAVVVSTVHHYLIKCKLRSNVSLICVTGDVVEDHHVACLIAMGGSAVYPYMAYELIRERFRDDDWTEKMYNYRFALEKGLMKIMSKMGISTLTSYHGSMLLHGIGLADEMISRHFPSISCVTGGLNLDHIKAKLLERNKNAFNSESPGIEMRGFFQFRKSGERHGFAPHYFKPIHQQAKAEPQTSDAEFELIYLRDLLDFKTKRNLPPLEQIEDVAKITKRFGSGGISFGAISEESHRILAQGLYLVGARSNTGEGGEMADRFAPGNPDKSVNSYVKQIASGRFGVSVHYLAAAREIQIKMAQGAKPGEGGQLPGQKVSIQIAGARSSTPGVPLISPPPHHDIYSIEDIAQLIYDLKQANPRARVSVKLVAQPGVGTVACGVAKAGADVILISGADGGTGASPLGSMKHAGMPWELGLPETHRALVANGLRSRVILRVDGGLKSARDIIIAAMLGAEEFDFGTSLLISLGCVMARRCHLNNCPAGIATQDEKYKAKMKGTPQNVENYLNSIAEQVRQLLQKLGVYSLDSIIGRNDLLKENPKAKAYVSRYQLKLDPIIKAPRKQKLTVGRMKFKPVPLHPDPHIDEVVIEETRQAIMTHGQAVVQREMSNTDRAVGTRLAGELAFLFGRGNFNGQIQYKLNGYAGQSFGAFLTDGIEMHLRGAANDYVGKGMSGGIISVRVPRVIRTIEKKHTIIGNVALYGATGGVLLVAGRAGERFAVRNSGASAVVEGVGNHCCEYMTRGTVVVLGGFGANFGAGMTGGVSFIYNFSASDRKKLNLDYVRTEELTAADRNLIMNLLRKHSFRTGSPVADFILDDWENQSDKITKVVPIALDIVDFKAIYDQHVALRAGVILNE